MTDNTIDINKAMSHFDEHDYVWLFGYLFKEVLGNPDNQVVSHDVEKVLGRKAKDFAAYVHDTVATGIWTTNAV